MNWGKFVYTVNPLGNLPSGFAPREDTAAAAAAAGVVAAAAGVASIEY